VVKTTGRTTIGGRSVKFERELINVMNMIVETSASSAGDRTVLRPLLYIYIYRRPRGHHRVNP